MNTYILHYQLADTYLEDRVQYREEHLALINDYHEKGIITIAGAVEPNPAFEAFIIFYSENEDAVIQFANEDPYVSHGLVKNYAIKKWNVVVS
ncbi:YciI family protein [Zhouia sp. PK063]|uniref:YciI family protein n=1 Tax=Zhouia sp. PK063 TaxID=3373602 RepID=UPI0037ADB7CE